MHSLPASLRRYLWLNYLVSAGFIGGSLALAASRHHFWPEHVAAFGWQILVFAILTYLGERTMMRISATLIQSLATSAHVAAMLLFPYPVPMFIALGAVFAAQLTAGDLALYKRAFNIAHTTTSVAATSACMTLFIDPTRILSIDGGLSCVPYLAILVALYYVLDMTPIVGFLSLKQRQPPWRVWLRNYQQTALPEVSAGAIGILAAVVWLSHPFLLALFAVPIVGLRIAFRAIKQAEDHAEALRRRGEQLEIVVAAGQDLRLHHTQADLLVPIAEAARAIAGAASVTAYLADPDDDTALQRIVLLPLDAPSYGPACLPRSICRRGIQNQYAEGERTLLVPLEPDDGVSSALLYLSGVSADITPGEMDALTLLATQTTIALQNARLHERALAQSSQDGLTELLNHRAFQTRLEEEAARARRSGQPLGLLMIDLDNFGAVNNRLGHQAGDTTLVAVSGALRATLRASDIAARYGGDEFAVILPETGMDEALMLAQRIGRALQQLRIEHRGIGIAIDASIGVAALPLHAMTREGLVAAADQAAYAAKRAGKGRICRPEEAALALDQDPSALITQLEHANMATVEALAAAVDAKDPYTRGHSQRVSMRAALLARAMGLSPSDVARVQLAGVLHDVGKIGVPDAILTKPGALTAEEFAIIKEHPATGERMLRAVPFLHDILPAVRHHHERWDGGGYPDGLAGAAIPRDAAIIMVADSFDAMTSSRTYRPALPFGEACRRIREGSGTQFAPEVVAAFERIVTDGSLGYQDLPDDGMSWEPLDATSSAAR